VCDSAFVSVCLRERRVRESERERVRKLLPLCARKEREKLLLNCRIWAKIISYCKCPENTYKTSPKAMTC